jgi:predicted acylesterase/phospholipase RssA
MTDSETPHDPLEDELTLAILRSAGGRRLLGLDQQEMSAFLYSAESSLSVRATDDPALRATIEEARAQARRRVDLVLEGRGITALALAGALVFLDESGYVIQRCAGSSGGAIVAALDACGYTAAEIRDILLATDFAQLRERTIGERLSRSSREGHYSGELLESWLADLLAARGVKTFGDLMTQASMQQSGSVGVLRGRLGGDVTSTDVVRELLLTHPSYASGRAASFELAKAPISAERQPVESWLAAVSALYRPDPDFLLDGRRLICGLAYLDAGLHEELARWGFLDVIEAELGGVEPDLTEKGRSLRAARRSGGDVPAPEAVPPPADELASLQILVSELVDGRPTLLVLPRDSGRLGVSAHDLSIAEAVRMSVSLESVFTPYVRRNPVTGREQRLADGTLAATFPVSLFDVSGAPPLWPTFGVRAFDPGASATSSDATDASRTIAIPVQGVSGAEFDLTRERALRLYEWGREACRDFLAGWSFERYLTEFRMAAS